MSNTESVLQPRLTILREVMIKPACGHSQCGPVRTVKIDIMVYRPSSEAPSWQSVGTQVVKLLQAEVYNQHAALTAAQLRIGELNNELAKLKADRTPAAVAPSAAFLATTITTADAKLLVQEQDRLCREFD